MAMRNYKITLKTLGPVHIGSGKKYNKKDYFFKNDKIIILDTIKFVGRLSELGLIEPYCEFLHSEERKGLDRFLDDNNLRTLAFECSMYEVDNTISRARRGAYQYHDVAEFVKDAYGCPYVPGSSVKGMLRTAILENIILQNQPDYEAKFSNNITPKDEKVGKALEREAFWRLKPDPANPTETQDYMRYVSVSDSKPLSLNDLVFVKKYDKFSKHDDGQHKYDMGNLSDNDYFSGNALNIYRESLKPGVVIEFTLTIDERLDSFIKLDASSMNGILKRSMDMYEESFLKHYEYEDIFSKEKTSSTISVDPGRCQYVYQGGPFEGTLCRNASVSGANYCNLHKDEGAGATDRDDQEVFCYLGGGVGYASKAVTAALIKDEAIRVDKTAHILYGQFPSKYDPTIHGAFFPKLRDRGFEPRKMTKKTDSKGKLRPGKDDHRHWEDPRFGVSPHTLKLGEIKGKRYLMGKCCINIKEV